MGYCMRMQSSNFFVSTENAGRVLAKMKDSAYLLECDEEGNITDIEFIGDKLYEDLTLFQSIAPYVRDGSYVEMLGEDGARWRWVFHDGTCKEIDAIITWPDEETTSVPRKEMRMNLYLNAKTNCSDLLIDYIEVELVDGKEVSLNWDESNISRSDEGFTAQYKGVYFGDEYANGRLHELQGMKILSVGLYTESDQEVSFEIEEMMFEDAGEELLFEEPSFEMKEVNRNGR